VEAFSVCILALTITATPPSLPTPHATGPGQKLRWEVEATLGLEYDSNATRLDSDSASGDPVQAGLLRGQGHFTLRYQPRPDLVLAGNYDLAGKVFFAEAARGQDTLIHRLTGALGLRLGNSLAARLSGLYHEGFQRTATTSITTGMGLFDFRLVDGRFLLAQALTPAVVGSFALGARRFTYKPDSALSFDAILGALSVDLHHTLGKGKTESELDVALSYTLSRRRFSSEFEHLCLSHIPGCELSGDAEPGQVVTFPHPTSTRRDLVHRLSLEFTWVRGVLVSGGYEYGNSLSNSFGFGYQRHELRAKVVTPLFWKIFGTVQIRARLMFYETATVVLDNPGFEEENRSHALFQLERELYKGLRIVLRYTLFVGDLTSPEAAGLRHLVFAGCSYRYRSQ
jgi:hypothetical protein